MDKIGFALLRENRFELLSSDSDEVKLIKMRDVFPKVDVADKFRIEVGGILYTESKVPPDTQFDELADDLSATLLRARVNKHQRQNG